MIFWVSGVIIRLLRLSVFDNCLSDNKITIYNDNKIDGFKCHCCVVPVSLLKICIGCVTAVDID